MDLLAEASLMVAWSDQELASLNVVSEVNIRKIR